MLRELARSYLTIVKDLSRVMNRLKALYRSWAIPCVGRDLKGLFKAAATRASVPPGPFQDFYRRSLAKGIQPTMVRLTLARKIAAITLTLWKKGENFDVNKLNSQAA